LGKSELNILFTSVGRRVELIRAFRDAYSILDLAGNIIATDIDPLAPALQDVDTPYLIPRFNEPDYLTTLIKICRSESVHLVIPLIDPEIPVLAMHREEIQASGVRLVVIPTPSVAICNDKWLTYKFLKKLGIPVPKTWLPKENEIDYPQLDFPVFIKPRSGSGGKNTFRVNNVQELEFFSKYIEDPVVQEYLPGPEITTDVICDLDGTLLGMVSRQRIEVRWGEVAKGVTVYYPGILEACSKIVTALNGLGPITVQCIMKDGKAYFTEINPRFGGGLPLGIAAGVNAPLWLLARTCGLPVTIPSLGEYETGLYLTRFDDSYFITSDDYKQLARNHF